MTERAVPERTGSGHGLSVGGYVRVAVFLIVITFIELGLIWPGMKEFYWQHAPWMLPMVVPVLLLLSGIKFAGVASFYMHLAQDRGLPRLVFSGPLLIALLIVLVLMLLYGRFEI